MPDVDDRRDRPELGPAAQMGLALANRAIRSAAVEAAYLAERKAIDDWYLDCLTMLYAPRPPWWRRLIRRHCR